MSPLPPNFTLLQVIPELETGGAEQTTLDVAHAVVRAGGKAVVATRGGRLATRLEGQLAPMPVHSKNPITMIGNTARLIELIRSEGVSLVHARSRAPAFSALWAAHAAKVPFVATYHGVYNAKSPLKRWYNAVMTRGDLVIANSEYTRAHVIAEHGVSPEKVVAIPRGIDLSRFDPKKVSATRLKALRKAWGVEDDGRLKVLLAGRLTRWKGQRMLIDAAAKLKNRDFLLIFAGDDQGRTDYRAELEAAIAAANLTDNVRIVGHCDDMPAAYLVADMAVAPSLDPEAFGRTAVEPQVMGRPVLASDHGAATETVEARFRVAPGDAEAWAKALAMVLKLTPDERAAIGAAAAKRARKLYSVSAMCEATLKVYARVLEGRGR